MAEITTKEWEEFAKEKGLTDEEFITEIFMVAIATGMVLLEDKDKREMSFSVCGYKLTVGKIEDEE